MIKMRFGSQRDESRKNDIYHLRKRTFGMFMVGVLFFGLVFLLNSIFRDDPPIWIGIYFVYVVLAAVFLFSLYLQINFVFLAGIFMGLTQFIFFPAVFFLEGGLYGPVPLWMTLHTLFIFLFFEKKGILLSVAGTICSYSYLFSLAYHDQGLIRGINSVSRLMGSSIFGFLALSAWLLLLVFVQQEHFLEKEQKMKQSGESVLAAKEKRNRFIYDLATATRQPMISMMGMCELILKEEQDHLIHQEMLTIRSACYDCLSLVDDTLSYAGLGQNTAVNTESNYRFRELLSSIVESVVDDMFNKQIRFIVEIQSDIPQILLGNSRRIRQVFLQILMASISMTSEGRIRMAVSAVRELGSEDVVFLCRISDTGRGMKPEEVEDILRGEKKHRVDKISNLEGVKLKLNVCREYLADMDGTIYVESLEFVGMTTTFTFKNRVVDEQPVAQVNEEKAGHILIFEEDDVDRENWYNIMDELVIKPHYVHNSYSFECAVRDMKFEHIFISEKVYKNIHSIIDYYHCEKETYVIGDYTNVYGDFGKCRLIRAPVYSVKIAEILRGEWNENDYKYSQRQGSFTAKGGKVLVIDDHVVDLKVATGIFAKYGVDIDIAVNGEEGLKKLKKDTYHLVVTDLMMPGMNGEEVLAKVRQISQLKKVVIPVAAIHSDVRENSKEITLKQGFDYYLSKPIKIKDIEECLLQYLPSQLIVKKEKKIGQRTDDYVKEERGLNIKIGISNIGYSEDSYAAILNTYYKENIRKQENLEEVFKKEEMVSFISVVHGIKSASASIGAMGLSALARELEYAGKDSDISLITQKLPLFLKEYQLILNEIKDYLLEHGKLQIEEDTEKWDTQVVDLSAEKLKVLKGQMDKMDLKECSATIEALCSVNYGAEDNEQIRKIKQAYNRFDFHNAKKALNELLENKS